MNLHLFNNVLHNLTTLNRNPWGAFQVNAEGLLVSHKEASNLSEEAQQVILQTLQQTNYYLEKHIPIFALSARNCQYYSGSDDPDANGYYGYVNQGHYYTVQSHRRALACEVAYRVLQSKQLTACEDIKAAAENLLEKNEAYYPVRFNEKEFEKFDFNNGAQYFWENGKWIDTHKDMTWDERLQSEWLKQKVELPRANLPAELQMHILDQIPKENLATAGQACRGWLTYSKKKYLEDDSFKIHKSNEEIKAKIHDYRQENRSWNIQRILTSILCGISCTAAAVSIFAFPVFLLMGFNIALTVMAIGAIQLLSWTVFFISICCREDAEDAVKSNGRKIQELSSKLINTKA